jgi:hypothetical protein
MNGRLQALGAGAGLLAHLGCVIWPAPTGDLLEGRGRIRREHAAPLEVGKATMEEVLLRLGEPDEVLEDGRLLLYRWTEVRGFFALAGMNSAVVIPFPGRREVRVRFDEGGRVIRIEFTIPEPPVPSAPGSEHPS